MVNKRIKQVSICLISLCFTVTHALFFPALFVRQVNACMEIQLHERPCECVVYRLWYVFVPMFLCVLVCPCVWLISHNIFFFLVMAVTMTFDCFCHLHGMFDCFCHIFAIFSFFLTNWKQINHFMNQFFPFTKICSKLYSFVTEFSKLAVSYLKIKCKKFLFFLFLFLNVYGVSNRWFASLW